MASHNSISILEEALSSPQQDFETQNGITDSRTKQGNRSMCFARNVVSLAFVLTINDYIAKDSIMPLLLHRFIDRMSNHDLLNRIISSVIAAHIIDEVEIWPLLNKEYYRNETDRTIRLFSLFQSKDSEDCMKFLTVLCNLEQAPRFSEKVRQVIQEKYTNSIVSSSGQTQVVQLNRTRHNHTDRPEITPIHLIRHSALQMDMEEGNIENSGSLELLGEQRLSEFHETRLHLEDESSSRLLQNNGITKNHSQTPLFTSKDHKISESGQGQVYKKKIYVAVILCIGLLVIIIILVLMGKDIIARAFRATDFVNNPVATNADEISSTIPVRNCTTPTPNRIISSHGRQLENGHQKITFTHVKVHKNSVGC